MAPASVSHPVPVRLVPRRARKERVVHERRTVAIELAEADPATFEPVSFAPSTGRERKTPDERGRALFAREGRLWHRLESASPARPVSRDEFLGFLAGAEPARQTDIERHFSRTPLIAARATTWGMLPQVERLRGEDGVTAGGRILQDFGAEAEAGLRAFLTDAVLLAGDAVYVRPAGPMAVQFRSDQSPNLQMTLFPRAGARVSNFCRPADLEAFREIQVRHSLPGTRAVGWAGELVEGEGAAMLPEALRGDEDLPILACCLAETLYGFAAAQDTGIEELARALHPAALLGQVGIVAGGSVEDALATLRGAAGRLMDKGGFYGSEVRFAMDFIDEVVRPRLAARADLDDADSLGGLAPR